MLTENTPYRAICISSSNPSFNYPEMSGSIIFMRNTTISFDADRYNHRFYTSYVKELTAISEVLTVLTRNSTYVFKVQDLPDFHQVFDRTEMEAAIRDVETNMTNKS